MIIPFNGVSQTIDFISAEREVFWTDSVMASMSLEEKVSQLIFIRAESYDSQARRDSLIGLIKELKPGGLVVFADTPTRQAQTINSLQSASQIPMLISIDAEWGLAMRLDSTIRYPFQMALGAINDNDLIYKMGIDIANQCRRMGIHINFAPVLDVNNNPENPVINYRSFGESPENVALKGWAYAKGLQDGGVLPFAKHFPGHGDTKIDSHLDLPVISHSRQRLDSIELYPFKYLIDKGLNGIMSAHLSIPVLDGRDNRPSSLSKNIVDSLLKNDMGFQGLIVTDALEMKGLTKYFNSTQAAIESFKAGNDILLIPEDATKAINGLIDAFRTAKLSVDDLNDRVAKILKVKFRFGLNEYKPTELENLVSELNKPESILLNRRLIESSITLIFDEGQNLPITKLSDTRIASLSIGRDSLTHFQKRLGNYTKIDHFQMGIDNDKLELDGIFNSLQAYDLIIVGIHDQYYRPLNTEILSDGIKEFLSTLFEEKRTIVASFRNPYTLNDDIFEKCSALITTYFGSSLVEDLTAQSIFGAIGFKGKLPVSINDKWSFGTGMSTSAGLRFKYTIPEEVGIDSDELSRRIERVVQLGLDSMAFPGAQILMAKEGKIFYHKTFGFHTYDKVRPVLKDDIYDFASVTKITGPLPALMKLHDEGSFDLNATLGDYLPYMKRSNKGDLDWRNILAHNARLKAWIPYWTTTIKENGKYKSKTLASQQSDDYSIKLNKDLYLHNDYKSKIYKMIKKAPMNENEGYVYSGLSFYLYPEIINLKTGIGYEEYLKKNFYEKLGAYTLTYNPLKHFDLDRIVPTEKDTFFRKMQIKGIVHDEGAAMMDGVSGNAGLFGSANDLAKLMQMYQNMGEYGGERYISEYTLRKFTTCQFCEEDNHRGLGFDKPLITGRENGTPAPSAPSSSFGHSGYTGTFTWADPENELLFVFFSNRVYPTRLNRKLYTLNIRPDIHQAVYDLINKN